MKASIFNKPDVRRGSSRYLPAVVASHPNETIIVLLFVTSTVLHLLTAARTVTFSDSGDFLMAIKTIGNCHGPGYPTYLLSAELFSRIFPFGSLAFRASAYSGLFASLTVCLIYWIVFRLSHSRIGGVAASLAYCFSFTFWYQTTIPETYSLDTFLIAMLIVLALRWERQLRLGMRVKADNTLAIFALVYGLGITNHYTILFLLPAFVFFALDTDWRAALAPRNLVRMAAFFMIGLLPYIYQPAAAFRGPAYNYGDPSTLLSWFRHVTLYYERGGLFKYPYLLLPTRVLSYFRTLVTEYPYFFWLAAVGFVYSFFTRRRNALFLVLLFAFSLLPVMMYDQPESILRAHFYYPSYMMIALWMGFGVACLVAVAKRMTARADRTFEFALVTVVVIVALVAVGAAAFVHFPKVSKADYDYARDMAREILAIPEKNGIVLTDEDNVVFPCMYLQIVDKVRPDLRVISSSSIFARGWQGKDLVLRIAPGYTPAPGAAFYDQIVEKNYADTPVYTTASAIVHFTWKEIWLGYAVRIVPEASTVDEPVRAISSLGFSAAKYPDIDSDTREAIRMPQALRATVEYGKKNYQAVSDIDLRITTFFQTDLYVPLLYSCVTYSGIYDFWGRALYALNKYQEIVNYLPQATKIDNEFVSLELARSYWQLGQYESALSELDKYLLQAPASVEALTDKGQILTAAGELDDSIEVLRTAVELGPQDQRALYSYGFALFKAGRNAAASRQLEAAVNIDPNSDLAAQARSVLEQIRK